ncbi:COG1470 family protein [Streptomyces sp. NPDC054766]
MSYALPAARVLGLTLVLLSAAPTALAAEGWSVVPAAGGAADGRPSVYAEGAPGTVLQDSVSVLNPGARPLTVTLRGADADNTAGGAFTVRERPTDTGAWIAFAGHAGGRRTAVRDLSVRVPAHTRADVPFTVAVPADAAPGDHPGAIVASGGGRTSAVRVQLRVGGPTLSALTVEHVRVGGGRISYELVNRGTTVLAPRLAVRADGVFATLLDRAPRALPVELLPGRRVTLHEPWTGPPALDAADVRLTVTAAGGVRSTATVSVRFVPWGAVAGAGGVLAALGALFVVRRRGRPGVRGPWRRGHRAGGDGASEQPRTEVELTGAVS